MPPCLHVTLKRVTNVSAEWKSLEKTKALTEKYDFIYGAYGIHPDNVGELDDRKLEELKSYLQLPKAVAVGEIGLDYYWNKEEKEKQIYWFEKQMLLAKEIDKPIIIHSRDAAEDTMKAVKKIDPGTVGGVVHCYAYSKEMAREYVDMGFHIGVGGVVTFKNGRRLKETVAALPLSALVLETDCPYLSPEPNRGKRNSSMNLPYVVRMIAELKGVTVEEVEEATWENACRMYRMEV